MKYIIFIFALLLTTYSFAQTENFEGKSLEEIYNVPEGQKVADIIVDESGFETVLTEPEIQYRMPKHSDCSLKIKGKKVIITKPDGTKIKFKLKETLRLDQEEEEPMYLLTVNTDLNKVVEFFIDYGDITACIIEENPKYSNFYSFMVKPWQ